MDVRAIGLETQAGLEMRQRVLAGGGGNALHHTAHRLAPSVGMAALSALAPPANIGKNAIYHEKSAKAIQASIRATQPTG
ncbi:hypothetical protein M1196_23280, partial [Salmonella enterica subsp. enterica serovar Oranienburg]|uniref:hypothetical protein n=1 Tax=Salmonella enterica TaxID=28901 RepID=UPI0021B277D8